MEAAERELAAAGITLETVARRLEEEGITIFTTSYVEALKTIEAKLQSESALTAMAAGR